MPQKLNSGRKSRTLPAGIREQWQQVFPVDARRRWLAGKREDGRGHVDVAGHGFADFAVFLRWQARIIDDERGFASLLHTG